MLSLQVSKKFIGVFAALSALFLFSAAAAFAESTSPLFVGEQKAADISIRMNGRIQESAIDEYFTALGITPNVESSAISAAQDGRKIEFLEGASIIRAAGRLVSLSLPVSKSGGHFWGESKAVTTAFEYFLKSTGKNAALRLDETQGTPVQALEPAQTSANGVTLVQLPRADNNISQSTTAVSSQTSSSASSAAVQPVSAPAASDANQQEQTVEIPEVEEPEETALAPFTAPDPFTGSDRPVVVVDAGHGGHDPGAMANSVREKDVNLKAALQLEKILQAYGIDVRLSRKTDVFLKLAERTEFANKNDADVFVSLHCNAMPKGKTGIAGLEYYIMAQPSDKDALNLAIAENKEVAEGVDSVEQAKQADRKTQLLLKILGDMQQNDKIGASTTLAEVMHSAAKSSSLPMRKVAQAPFFVLRGAGMPAVLVEMGYLTNAAEARKLSDASYRERLCRVIAQGIVKYIKDHPTVR